MTFQSPIWLYIGIFALAALVGLGLYSRGQKRKMLAKFASPRLIAELTRTVSRPKTAVKNALVFFAVAAVFAALARPQWGYRWEEAKSRGIDIIFAIDTSKSMLAEDVKPDRLERAKLSVLDLIDVLKGDRIGIVAFSGQAFLQCPLTLDYDAFRMSLEALDTDIIRRGGTNISAAINEAEAAFASTSNKKIVILISDGEELEDSAVKAAEKAAKSGTIIYTLGVGGAKGEYIPVRDATGAVSLLRDESGQLVQSRLNEEILTKIAKAAGGFYAPLTANGMDAIYNDGLKKIPSEELSSKMKQSAIERFQIPLGIAVLLLAVSSLVGTRKFFAGKGVGIAAALVATLLVLPHSGFAQNQSEDVADENLPQQKSDIPAPKPETKKYELSEQPVAREVFNLALDASRSGDFADAKELFLNAAKLSPEDLKLHSKIYYNIGNIDYAEAKKRADKMPNPEKLGQSAQTALAQSAAAANEGTQILREGLKLLDAEKKSLESAKTDEEKKAALEKSPLKDKQFQEKLKKAIGQSEGSAKLSEETSKAIDSAKDSWQSLGKSIEKPVSEYSDALSLDSENADAAANLDSAKAAKTAAEKIARAAETLAQSATPMLDKAKETQTKLAEELKKLLRDDNQNQQNQNQNQNQQQNQQNNQDQQQNQQNQNQNKDRQQNNQDKNQNSKDNKDKQNSEQNKEKNSDKQKDKQENKENKNSENKNGEQAVENPSKPDENESENGKEGNREKKDEQAAPAEQKQAQPARQSEAEKAQARENFRKEEGAMTRAEARQLLDSMKDGEKVLPMRGFGTQKQRYESSYKDW